MADEDDDDSFGEFTFASSNYQTTFNSASQIPSTTNNNNDLNYFQNNISDHNPKSPQPHTNWNKINGALPLSLFGGDDNEEEEEEEENENDFKQSAFSGNTGFVSRIHNNNNNNNNNLNDKSNAKLGINDLIANLYGPKQQNQQQNNKAVDNGEEMDSIRSKDLFLNSDPLSLITSTTPAARNHRSDDDEGGWELIDAFSDSKLRQNEIAFKNNKERLEKTVSASGVQGGSLGAVDLFAGANIGFYAESNGNEPSSDPVGESDDFDDTFGEFETAFTEQTLTNKEMSEKTMSSLGQQDASHGPIDLFASANNGVFVESHVKDSGFDSKPFTNFQNVFTKDVQAQSKGSKNELSSSPLVESEDFDDTFGEFETSFTDQSSTNKDLSKERFNSLGSHDVPHRPVDLFAFSNGVPGGSHMVNTPFDFSQSSVVQNGVTSDPFSQTEWKETKDNSDLQSPGAGVHKNSGNIEITFPEIGGSKPKEAEGSSKNYKEAVPLSIFGIEEEPEADSSLNLQFELFKSSTHGKHTRNQSSNLSINDILSDLYGQAEPISSANHEVHPDEKVDLRHSTGKEYSFHDDDDDDGFNDGSWEFKDASFQSKVKNQKLSFEKKLIRFKDYYSKLKEDLCVVARHHLHGLKKAQSTTTHDGEEMELAGPNKDFQEALKELRQNDIIATEIDVDDDHLELVISFDQYIETLHEPEFQVLDSEYHISRKLSLAETDLRTAIDLINHFSAVLMALTLAPKGEPADYVSLWFKVISACSQELKHGTWIWKQSVEKNVHSELLSEPQGKQFIMALGEIYRSVVILGAAVTFYKPWILLSGVDLEEIYSLIKECHFLWSASGLEETIPAEYLLESISHIRNLDELAIANEILSHKESQCQLSLLSPGVVPEMKMVVWNEDKYFVALANLWGNLISPNPPKLSVHVS
ncbi:uncharacterized protein [Rutidosis leptorrhynchoides]|uniref:uncharacterized protein n=1 Tax=Rutidosis leptorrhynchoides TaxID=125765 RepID=UPI003A9A11FF